MTKNLESIKEKKKMVNWEKKMLDMHSHIIGGGMHKLNWKSEKAGLYSLVWGFYEKKCVHVLPDANETWE